MTGNSRFAVSVHILSYLAFRKDAAVPSAEIASSVDTNPVVIRRLLAALVKAKLVLTRKGAAGGFSLARNPAGISLLEIYRAVEPAPMHGMDRFNPNHRCPVGARIEQILQDVFAKAQAAMEAELGGVTIADVEKQLHSVCTRKR
jgi:Rrf2 family protein